MMLTATATKFYPSFPAPGQGSPSLQMTWAEETVNYFVMNALRREGVVLTA